MSIVADKQTEQAAADLLLRLEGELRVPLVEALEAIARTARNARRSGRQARPVPQASFDAALELIEELALGALHER
jgi:hypothetical protein